MSAPRRSYTAQVTINPGGPAGGPTDGPAAGPTPEDWAHGRAEVRAHQRVIALAAARQDRVYAVVRRLYEQLGREDRQKIADELGITVSKVHWIVDDLGSRRRRTRRPPE